MRGRGAGSPRLIAGMFVVAFAATILTVIYTGLLVEAPRTEIAAGLPTIDMAVDRERAINLVFVASASAEDVTLRIALPAGVDLVGHEGEREVRWRSRLAAGNNFLPLTLLCAAPTTGQIVARLSYGEREKVFRILVRARDL